MPHLPTALFLAVALLGGNAAYVATPADRACVGQVPRGGMFEGEAGKWIVERHVGAIHTIAVK